MMPLNVQLWKRFPSPSSILLPYFQEGSCTPYTPGNETCALGNQVSYAINSTGKGALGLWTHNLKSIDFITQYQGLNYSGSAVRLGAGVQAFEAYAAASAAGLIILGGWCPTVGITGGFVAGGGHGPLTSTLGLAADNVLEMEVVTADGQLRTLSPTENSDLFWAIRGGGGGTFGVTISVTAKVFPDRRIGAANFQLLASAQTEEEAFWDAVDEFHSQLPTWVDQGGFAAFILTQQLLYARPLTFPGKSQADVEQLLAPLSDWLDARNITYSLTITEASGLLQHVGSVEPLPYGEDAAGQVTGGRFIPRQTLENNRDSVLSAARSILQDPDFRILGTGMKATTDLSGLPAGDNAIPPAWREAILGYEITAGWNYTAPFAENALLQQRMTTEAVPALEQVTPGSGAYLNEANFQQPDWQHAFYGSNYARLLQIKQKYDPESLFYAATAVGSEAWEVADDGRLCRAQRRGY
ncbi:hypothetical protein DV735_g1054, partial [Chaetothyriales sp. CBS 134920]